MSIQFSLEKRLFRAAVSLGFLACLMAAETVSSRAATSESSVPSKTVMNGAGAMPGSLGSRCANPNSYADLMLTMQVEAGLPDQFGMVLEDDDSIEMLRVDFEQRTFGFDREAIGSRVASKISLNIRPSISPPLLV